MTRRSAIISTASGCGSEGGSGTGSVSRRRGDSTSHRRGPDRRDCPPARLRPHAGSAPTGRQLVPSLHRDTRRRDRATGCYRARLSRGVHLQFRRAFAAGGLLTGIEAPQLLNPIRPNSPRCACHRGRDSPPRWERTTATAVAGTPVRAGRKFEVDNGNSRETPVIAGLAAGPALPEQWGARNRPVDYSTSEATSRL